MKKSITILLLILLGGQLFTQVNIELAARMDGKYELDDGTEAYLWGYSYYNNGNPDELSLPSPLLRVYKGDSVNLHFHNESRESHTIHLHGLDVDQNNDGVPTTSFSVLNEESAVYRFKATHSGNYLYHCHVMTTQHLSMGMYGMISVRNSRVKNELYDNGPTYTRSFDYLYSEMDSSWNKNPISPGFFYDYNSSHYMLNGKLFSRLLQDSSNFVIAGKGDTVLLNLLNIGYHKIAYHFPVTMNAEIHMSDGRQLPEFQQLDTLSIYPGERYSVLIYPDEIGRYDIKAVSKSLYRDKVLRETDIPVVIRESVPVVSVDVKTVTKDFEVSSLANGFRILSENNEIPIHVFSLNGKRVVSQEHRGESIVSMQGLAPGVYLIVLGEKVKKVHWKGSE